MQQMGKHGLELEECMSCGQGADARDPFSKRLQNDAFNIRCQQAAMTLSPH
jgi:hypothetical protein